VSTVVQIIFNEGLRGFKISFKTAWFKTYVPYILSRW